MNNFPFYYNRMENYSFSDIRLDSNIKRYHYLPYLDNISAELVDEYNKFILKRRFGYYQDMNNPNIYFNKDKRLINDNDMLVNHKKEFDKINDLINNLYYYFDIAYKEVDYYKRPIYSTYKKIVIDNLNQESIRLNSIIDKLNSYKVDNRKKKYNLYYLFIIIILLFYIMILSFNYYRN